jgi:DNA polymerase I-like protein with 3'-5' exonuclease and polymerase domains
MSVNLLVIDLETYFDDVYNLKQMTIPEYVSDPRFHIHGAALRWPDGRAEFATNIATAIQTLKDAFGMDLERTTVVCHHAAFDLYILNRCCGLRPRSFVDTMLLAHHVHGPSGPGNSQGASLRALADRYGLPPKGNLDFMRGVRFPDVKQATDLREYACRDAEITYELAVKLLPQVTRPEVELRAMMHTVRLFTERMVRVDTAGIDRLAADVLKESEDSLKLADVTAEAVSRDSTFVPLLEQALGRTGRKVPLKPGKNGPIPATAKKDEAMQALVDDDDPVVAALARARLGKRSEDQKLARLRTMKSIAMATGGGLPAYLVYGGAVTGRFAGGGKFNLQNLGRTGLGARVRQLLVAEPGHVFVIADLAQIEARITAWHASEIGMLDAFRSGRDIYSEFAAATFGCEVRKPREDDPPAAREQLKGLRQVGKQAVLGLGFQMGGLKFMNTLRADPLCASLFDSGRLSPAICKEIVDRYRREYVCIKALWGAMEWAARRTIDGQDTVCRKLRFSRQGDVLLIWLPSGRALRYPDIRTDPTPRTVRYLDKQGIEAEFAPNESTIVYGSGVELYGGKLVENVVQATARDILVEALLALEARDIPILFHVHDEVIAQVPEDRGDESLAQINSVLTTSPAWAPELPLEAEVRKGQNYAH